MNRILTLIFAVALLGGFPAHAHDLSAKQCISLKKARSGELNISNYEWRNACDKPLNMRFKFCKPPATGENCEKGRGTGIDQIPPHDGSRPGKRFAPSVDYYFGKGFSVSYGACFYDPAFGDNLVFQVYPTFQPHGRHKCGHSHCPDGVTKNKNCPGTGEDSSSSGSGSGESGGGDNSCKYANDGECDEPRYCRQGTDSNDCKGAGAGTAGGSSEGDSSAGGGSGGTPPPTGTKTETKLREFGDWHGQLDVTASTDNGSHLYIAARYHDIEAVRWLIANGADIHERYGKITPLGSAVRGKSWGEDSNAMVEIMKLLIAKGAEVNVIEQHDYTPLHVAAERNKMNAAKVLLDSGADVNEDTSGWTPLDQAYSEAGRGGYDAMQSLLRQHGGRCNKFC